MELRDQLLTADDREIITSVNLAELAKALDGSMDTCKDDWFTEVFEMKLQDDCMGALIENILDFGLLSPINIVISYGEELKIGNGHHRFVASLLAGVETVDVLISWDYITWDNDITARGFEDGESVDHSDWTIATDRCYRDVLNEMRNELCSL